MNQPSSSTRWIWPGPRQPMSLWPRLCVEATNIPTYSRLQRKKANHPNLFPSKTLPTNLPVQPAWNTPSPELPAPKATLHVGARAVPASFHSLPRGFPQRPSGNSGCFLPEPLPLICRGFWEGIRDASKTERPRKRLRRWRQ